MSGQTDSVTVQFRLNSSDVFRTLVRQTVRKMWLLLLMPICGLISAAWLILDPGNSAVTWSSAAVMLTISALLFVVQPYLQTAAAMKAPNFGGAMRLTLSGAGIEFAGEHSNGNLSWSMVKSVSRTKQALLIHLNPAGFQVVPRRALSAADVAAIENILRLHAPGKSKAAKA
jgi:YcxB-like protein